MRCTAIGQLEGSVGLTLLVVGFDALALDHDEASVYSFDLGDQLLLTEMNLMSSCSMTVLFG